MSETVRKEGGAEASAAGDVGRFTDQAAQAAAEAKTMVSALAGEAKDRVADILDRQRLAGAEQVAGVAKAAHHAADDLDGSSPHLARFVRSAAQGVDSIADDIRGRSLGDILSAISDFGRRQPVALFGGAVVAGFVLARFLKSEAPGAGSTAIYDPGQRPDLG